MTAGKEVPRRPPWLAVGLALVLCAFIYRLAATGGWSQPPTVPRLNQEQLEQLALSLGAAALPSAAGDVHHQGGGGKQWQWGPSRTPGTASRGGKYVITSVMGLQPERLNIFVASLRRWSPSTQLVVFVEEQTDSSLLKAAGAEVIPFKMPTDSALVLHRSEWQGRSCRAVRGCCGAPPPLPGLLVAAHMQPTVTHPCSPVVAS